MKLTQEAIQDLWKDSHYVLKPDSKSQKQLGSEKRIREERVVLFLNRRQCPHEVRCFRCLKVLLKQPACLEVILRSFPTACELR